VRLDSLLNLFKETGEYAKLGRTVNDAGAGGFNIAKQYYEILP
jgi:hypothetical protein